MHFSIVHAFGTTHFHHDDEDLLVLGIDAVANLARFQQNHLTAFQWNLCRTLIRRALRGGRQGELTVLGIAGEVVVYEEHRRNFDPRIASVLRFHQVVMLLFYELMVVLVEIADLESLGDLELGVGRQFGVQLEGEVGELAAEGEEGREVGVGL